MRSTKLHKLSVKGTASLTKRGMHSDGGGLYLRVDSALSRRWSFIFHWQGRRKEMSLGPSTYVSLPEARQMAADARAALFAGRNPLEVREREASAPTFEQEADALIEQLKSTWKNPDEGDRWRTTFQQHAPGIWTMRIDAIETEDVLRVFKTIWTTKPEMAAKLRGRIERVIDAATAKGLRSGPNPARWNGHLQHLLGKRLKLTKGHHKALPYKEAKAFMEALQVRTGMSARALEFVILTASRENEVLGAKWGEIDREAKVWTVPAARMKNSLEHKVPLTDAAIAVIGLADDPDQLIFPSDRHTKMSNMAMDMLLRRMDSDVTVHGFRSTFRDWAGDETDFPREVAEAALAHKVGDAVEQAYRRNTALERRRTLMEAWAAYLGRPQAVQRKAA